jgi:hypothetical protein
MKAEEIVKLLDAACSPDASDGEVQAACART